MSIAREIKRLDTGILVATLTPEEQAKMDELTAQRDRLGISNHVGIQELRWEAHLFLYKRNLGHVLVL